MKAFYEPTAEHLAKLSLPWCASYSGGKDSTSLVTWVEWLRRAGHVRIERPKLVRSDTGVEETALVGVAEEMTAKLERSGWECALVRPEVHERLYCQILGRGLPPIHPGARRMRWCTRSTKIDPMSRVKEAPLWITGLRLGESAMRDGKLKRSGCAAGGECGIPDPGEGRYSPILHWSTCHVMDWLNGNTVRSVRASLKDLLPTMRRLLEVYAVEKRMDGFDFAEPEYQVARFGCIGCPAIGAEREPPKSVIRRNGAGSPLNELYDVWHEARLWRSRLIGTRRDKTVRGPIKLAVRQQLFARVMDIQRRSGVVLVTPEDEAFIRDCWARKVYPRGWSEADELTQPPAEEFPLFANQQ